MRIIEGVAVLTVLTALGTADRLAPSAARGAEGEQPSDLTLGNLFSEGWDQPFQERPDEGSVPRFRLFRTRPAFLEREVRVDFRCARNADDGEFDEYEIEPELDLPFNRRFMIELEPEYVWLDGHRGNPSESGSSWSIGSTLQLIDTVDSAANVQFALGVPSEEAERTRLGVTLAGFRDLGYRIGLQSHVGFNFFTGTPVDPDDVDSQLHFGLALTKTLARDYPGFQKFTFFVETFGVTNLDGDRSGHTDLSVLPAVRWEIGNEWWVAAGYETPVTSPRPFDKEWHFALLKDF
jgi:hypothetical protein